MDPPVPAIVHLISTKTRKVYLASGHRIYKEIGPGDRIALCKLAVDTLEETGRPLRLAIDFSIWQFQVQAAKGKSSITYHLSLNI